MVPNVPVQAQESTQAEIMERGAAQPRACFAELADQFCCINAAKIIAAHTAWFGPKSFAWPWVWAMGVGGCCSRGEKITRVAVTLL